MTKQQKKRIKKWIEALRSGKYKLGVADIEFSFLGENSSLPPEVIAWFELPEENPIINKQESLVVYNDTGKTFKQIATLIEKEYLSDAE